MQCLCKGLCFFFTSVDFFACLCLARDSNVAQMLRRPFLLLSPDAVFKMQMKPVEELIYLPPLYLLMCSANNENGLLNANFILVP